jgi:hypothetical protein
MNQAAFKQSRDQSQEESKKGKPSIFDPSSILLS